MTVASASVLRTRVPRRVAGPCTGFFPPTGDRSPHRERRPKPARGRGGGALAWRGRATYSVATPRRPDATVGADHLRRHRTVRGAQPRRGSSDEDRARWAATYAATPYDALPWFSPEPSRAVQRAASDGFLAPGAAVLDIGCGAGSNLLFLARHGYEAHGIDLSPGAVHAVRARARSEGLTVDAQTGDVLALDFPDHRFGSLVDIGCFHTIPLRRREDYAREVARVLRPCGTFVLSWVAREHTAERGPPHRPSLAEVTDVLEAYFVFVRTEFCPPGEETGPAVYDARLSRRASPQPPRR